ncbi:Alpha-glucosidase, glycosyl hydrolase family GH31 [Granulicella rosea]|uniref:Alpha-glucosidase, glycosyl hydrolase family GH31 n=1 Tax=Granulicella rosea TaxID=474952 RepID=A0A239EPB5_9BACT|nr:TIM-barrel domain-containing protein [Granulicella rosea]SNS46088.1 Alpha-glucosidase, glycosyl hydrolase family GH31 [Granulicella rosea]
MTSTPNARSFTLAAVLASTSCAAMAQIAPSIDLQKGDVSFLSTLVGTRYEIRVNKRPLVDAATTAGILLGGSPVSLQAGSSCKQSPCTLSARTSDGQSAKLTIAFGPHTATLTLTPEHPGLEVRFVTAGATPAYGLADHAVEQTLSTLPDKSFNTDVTGFADDAFQAGQGNSRLIGNFILYPTRHFAVLLIDPNRKIVHTSADEIVQGVASARSAVTMQYFFGDMHQIYKAYLDARNAAGYRVFMPKYQAFGVGWEAFGALGWNTNQSTDLESIDRYLHDGYPLRWAAVGSGFWPAEPASMHETTSFGLWDHHRYPDPKALVQHLTQEHLALLFGLRITFITTGPYSAEGAAKGYFLKDKKGEPASYVGMWPRMPYYLLDAHNPAALDWYMNLVGKWQQYGVTGWKEDFYGYNGYDLRDDKVDPINDRLMQQGQMVIERNGYLSSNGDLHRINDFNYNQDQDRGPVNALALAYSGFPLVYPDIVGGTFTENRFDIKRTPQMEIYMQRNAMWASLHASMGMGEPPWTFSPATAAIMLQAARLHARIAPYIYSNARRFASDGYPWPLAPLPVAFTDDPQVYARDNAATRGYEWMIGDALLATPLYGNDYNTATTRDIYLPEGQWMDFDTGQLYSGHQLLRHFALPPNKTPLFVGGSGVTLEDRDGALKVCVYPVAQNATATFTLPDDPRPITVKVQGLPVGQRWTSAIVADSRGTQIKWNVDAHSISFPATPGETYQVHAVAKP